MPGSPARVITEVQDWLTRQALLAPKMEQLIPATAERLRNAGLPLARLHLASNILHPQFSAISFAWWDDEPVVSTNHFTDPEGEDYRTSPYMPLIEQALSRLHAVDDRLDAVHNTVTHRRFRLDRGEGLDAHPVLATIAARGVTDYLACTIGFGIDGRISENMDGIALSWSTRCPKGFDEAEIATLIGLVPSLGAAIRTGLDRAIARSVLSVYLGEDAGARVLAGNIHRGQLEAVRAAILYGDLRGFTTVSDQRPGTEVVALLDRLFEAMAEPVLSRGGEVMKFMGDAILATFALDAAEEPRVCAAALDAAIEAEAAVDAVNRRHLAEGKPAMPLDQALHLGTVMYGNVGTKERLDFTVIGPAVNEASRMEALCQPLSMPIIVSRSFVDAAQAPHRFRALGNHSLRGVSDPRQIFTVAAP